MSKLPSNARRAFLRPANQRPLNGLTPSRIIGVALPVTIASTYFATAHICRILSLSTSPALRTPYQAAALYHIVRVPYDCVCPNGLPVTDRVGAFCKRAGERRRRRQGITSFKNGFCQSPAAAYKKEPKPARPLHAVVRLRLKGSGSINIQELLPAAMPTVNVCFDFSVRR